MKLSSFLLAGAASLAMAVSAGSLSAAELRAGAARADITPSADEFPYRPHTEQFAYVGVHDPIFARALVLDDGAHRAAVVILDQTTVPDPETLTRDVAAAAGVQESALILAATHTHNVLLATFHGGEPDPTIQREMRLVHDGAVEAARKAAENLAPARVGFARGEAWVNVNNGEGAGLTTEFDPMGPSDKTLDVIRVTDAADKPLALLVSYPSHAEVMFRSLTKDGGAEITGDLPGAVSGLLEASDLGAPVVLFAPGAEGNQLPYFKSLQKADRLPAFDEGAGGWALLDVQARRVANAALAALDGTSSAVDEATISVASAIATCPGQRLKIDGKTGVVTTEDKPPVDIPLTAIKVGDLAIAGVGGDVGAEIGTAIRRQSPVANTMLVTVTAGMVGYVEPDSMYEKPGHAVAGSPLKPGCAEPAVAGGIASLLASLGNR